MNRLIPFSSAMALSVGTAFGVVLYRQDFESHTPGALSGQDGFTAMSQAQVAAGGLSYENGDVAIDGGGQCVSFTGLTPANNWVFSREFPEQISAIDTFYYFSGSANESNERMQVDNIRIGTTWEDVFPPPPSRATVLSIH